jgi:hypothetical protein
MDSNIKIIEDQSSKRSNGRNDKKVINTTDPRRMRKKSKFEELKKNCEDEKNI